MKKILVSALCLAAFLSLFATSARAEGGMNFYLRSGIVTPIDFSFNPYHGLIGANIDLNFGALSLSPECDVLIHNFFLFTFDPIYILPGVLLNVNLINLYFGAGAVLPLRLGSAGTIEYPLLIKANAGLKLGGFKLQLFVFTPANDLFNNVWIGATFGAGF